MKRNNSNAMQMHSGENKVVVDWEKEQEGGGKTIKEIIDLSQFKAGLYSSIPFLKQFKKKNN